MPGSTEILEIYLQKRKPIAYNYMKRWRCKVMNIKNLLILQLTAVFLVSSVNAAVYTVPGDYSTIQSAIDGAPSGSTIEVAPGTYTEYIQALDMNKNIYLKGTGGASSTFISGNDNSSLLRLENAGGGSENLNLVWEGFTFERGRESATAASPVTVVNSRPSFINCVFRNNRCFDRAGAVLVYGPRADVSFTDCVFSNNVSDRLAGAVLVNGESTDAVFKRCLFVDNTCRTPDATDWNQGGAIYIGDATAEIYDCVFRNNSAMYAGGAIMLLNWWDKPEERIEIRGCEFYGNYCEKSVPGSSPPSEAGAVMAENNLDVLIDRCIFSNNWADAGGTIHSYRANLTVTNSVITDSFSTGINGLGYGGGIGVNANDSGDSDRREPVINVYDTLIRNCMAPAGGGFYASGDGDHNDHVQVTMENVTIDSCMAVTNNGSPGVGGGLFLGLADCDIDQVALVNNWCDWVGGALAVIQDTTLAMKDTYVVGNDGWAQGDIHNPDNLPISEDNVTWAYNPAGSESFEELWSAPGVIMGDEAFLTYLKSPYGSGVTVEPGSTALADQGGYAAGSVAVPTLTNTVFALDPSSPLQEAGVEQDQGYGLRHTAFPAGIPELPASIQFEDFDRGGYGVGYYDTDRDNRGGAYRPDEGVDILSNSGAEGSGQVAYVYAGEWLEYTIYSPSEALWDLTVRYTAPGESAVAVDVDGEPWIEELVLPGTGGWDSMDEFNVSGHQLPAGTQRIRFRMLTGGLDLDSFELSMAYTNPVLSVSRSSISVYAVTNGAIPATMFTIQNIGADSLDYGISEQAGWMTVSPTSGVSSGEADTITVNYDVTGMSTGLYSSSISITSSAPSNATAQIPVTLRIFEGGAVKNDFDGDRRTDIGIYRPSEVTWYVFQTSDGPMDPFQFGAPDDIPVPADYDGDGRADLAVFRPSTVTWYVFGSSAGPMEPFQFGTVGDLPVPADYDGDGRADLAIYRPSTMTWYVFGSSAGPIEPFVFGGIGDIPVPADYDGDGRADLAVFRPSNVTWYVFGSSAGPMPTFQFGTQGDLPVPGDYDGDGKVDKAIFRPSTVTWYIFGTSAGPMEPFQFGTLGDRPIR
jgi:hypothetical protein